MIMQYLANEGYNASQMTIQDEANVKWHEREENTNETRRLKKAILGMRTSVRWAYVSRIQGIKRTCSSQGPIFFLNCLCYVH